ncbi:hypothetical protein ACFOUP_01220 [Belliella kenyensis]|uniref:DUF4136 domain-containing protein n=1 Tax=Belliella kenyensis TaxID=1472724 RepID=A0ABV8EGF9_9BACT|nr:hypothetical protein [Belliella kenyensis]MCH7401185.1 hypothetical protein [Belliella kenyensis]MDN3604182.1 hypothetical protein [Belliella kenyensis]
MKNSILITLVALLTLSWACAPSTQITASWKSEEAKTGYSSIYIAALTEDLQIRQSIENEFSNRLQNRSVSTTKSIESLRPDFFDEREPSKDKILEAIQATNSEAILTVTLIDIEEEERYVQGGPVGGGFAPMGRFGYYGNFGGYFNHWHGAGWNQGYYVKDKEYFLETNLYDSSSLELLWSAQSKTLNPNDIESFAREFVDSMKKELRSEGLIN